MARPFMFNLQPVLEQRKRREDACQHAVMELERRRVEVESRIRRIQAGIASAHHEMRDLVASERRAGQGRGVPIGDVRLAASAAMGLVARAQRSVIELAGLHEKLNAARIELIRASADKKAVERLRERRHESWRREQSRREIAELDDITMARVARKDVSP